MTATTQDISINLKDSFAIPGGGDFVSFTNDNHTGTWFLSYLCEIGLVTNFDTVEWNYLDGRLKKGFLWYPCRKYR